MNHSPTLYAAVLCLPILLAAPLLSAQAVAAADTTDGSTTASASTNGAGPVGHRSVASALGYALLSAGDTIP